ncbi:hypothetical protein [Actinacidiphila acididurans]|uniref:Uncharacterized protein n=1 Tax=Actinacidiphila acididurans TaxID=2784346 RepID=A0ABS2TPN2_9ACTN|nr:hypothetical protein [Actinacidiphila acididurans]MBM9505305.1 hypothetical protein [Actinacidiphila acididurans]
MSAETFTATVTLADVSGPVLALRLLLSEHPDLPAGTIRFSDLSPDRLDVWLHDDLRAFETWRAVLGIDPHAVTCDTQSDDRTWVLKATGEYAGVRIELTSFSDVPAPEQAGGVQ